MKNTPKLVARPALKPLVAAIACALPLAAFAQAPAKKPEKDTALPEVQVTGAEEGFKKESTSTATRTDTPLRDIPQFINTVPQPLIRSQNATSISDALRNVPGISYAAGEGGTQANQVFYLRGFPAGGDIFIDGVRDLGEYNRDLFATDTVEVLKGPSALAFGRGSPGGIINQTSKLADQERRGEAALTLGSFSQRRLTADVNLPMGETTAFRALGMAEDTNAFRYPQDVRRRGFAPSVSFGLTTPTQVTLAYYYLKTHDVTDYGQPTIPASVTGGLAAMPPVSPRNYYGYANHDYTDHETHIFTATVKHDFGGGVDVRNTTRVANYKRQVEATIPSIANTDRLGRPLGPATPLADLLVTRNHDGNRTRDNDDDAFVNQTDLTWRIWAGETRHTVLAGVELAREKLDRWNYILDANPDLAGVQTPTSQTPLLAPDPSTRLGYTKTPNIRAVGQGDTVAAFVQDQVQLSREWKALVGGRFERFEAEARTESKLTGATLTGPFGRTDSMWSGRAGLIWQPTQSQSYYLAAGNSYNPSGELGVYGQTGTNLNATNEDLAPEKNVGYEMGATWDLREGLQVRAAVFHNEKTNARQMNEVGQTVLTGKRRIEGLELQFSGRLTPNWEVYSGVAFMDGTISSTNAATDGRFPLGVPKVSGNLWTIYRVGPFELGGGVRGSGDFWLNDANTGKVPAYHAVDATVAYTTAKYEIRLNATNLTDKTYYVGGYQNAPNRVLPGAPRTLAVTLRYFF